MFHRSSWISSFSPLLFGSFLLFAQGLRAESKPKEELLIGAASSLKDGLEAMQPLFEKQEPQLHLTFQFAASGTLQQQIEQGAPMDFFISAAKKQVDELLKKDLLVPESVANLAGNTLVLIVPRDKPGLTRLDELKNPAYSRIAIGEARSVPAGEYAEAWLQKYNLLSALQGRLVPAANVRQVLSFVETGNVSAGFVYGSDALTSSRVKVALRASPGDHPPIVYPMALVKKSKHAAAAQRFLKFLQSAPARRILSERGFVVPAEKAS